MPAAEEPVMANNNQRDPAPARDRWNIVPHPSEARHRDRYEPGDPAGIVSELPGYLYANSWIWILARVGRRGEHRGLRLLEQLASVHGEVRRRGGKVVGCSAAVVDAIGCCPATARAAAGARGYAERHNKSRRGGWLVDELLWPYRGWGPEIWVVGESLCRLIRHAEFWPLSVCRGEVAADPDRERPFSPNAHTLRATAADLQSLRLMTSGMPLFTLYPPNVSNDQVLALMADRSRRLGFDPRRPDRRHEAEARMRRAFCPLLFDLADAGHDPDQIAKMTTLEPETVERWWREAERTDS
jgi:hypothetical protein